MRILVIEDDRTTGDYILQGLRQEGHAADLCRNGPDGLIAAQTSDFDLAIGFSPFTIDDYREAFDEERLLGLLERQS